ncbi:hypothetical protein TruAng_003486 [Truncatella angustata]|nr:hypothetical protein TruAng_003486 [Truncatella angustata]
MPDLADSILNTSFWSQYLPLYGLQVEGIRHALIALGAAHKDFLLRGRKIAGVAQRDNERFIILHYNLAIRHIQPLMSQPTTTNIQATLICCLLFICFENLRGQYTEAIQHLRAGARLLASLKGSNSSIFLPSVSESDPTVSRAQYETATHVSSQDNMDALTTLFSCLGIDVSIFLEDEVVPLEKLSQVSTSDFAVETATTNSSFTCLSAARKELHRIEIAHDIFFEQLCHADGHKPLPAVAGQENSELDRTPPEFSEKDKNTYRGIYRMFWKWSRRFDTFMDHYQFETASPKETGDALRVRLQQKTWCAILDETPWLDMMEASFERGSLESMVDDAELIIQSMGSLSRPFFTCDADIIPCLALVGCFTDDRDLLHRVITALRRLNRREGVWDSQDLAEIFEAAITAREQLGLPIKVDFAGGVLSMAKMLLSLNIPCISATNSIVPLAQSVKTTPLASFMAT